MDLNAPTTFLILFALSAFSGPFQYGVPAQISPISNVSIATTYIEQILLSFKQNFPSLSYNVSAIEQCGSEGGGPAYLLNGLSDAGYWYQVGLSWRWGYPTTTIHPGFNAIFAVYAPNGTEVFLSGEKRTVLDDIVVNQGDNVLLSLFFSGGNVALYVYDWNTGSAAEESFPSPGATQFAGTPNGYGNSKGYFTGLMTEQYHASLYYGGEQEVTYRNSNNRLSSAWAVIDEISYPSFVTQFISYSSIVYVSPFQFQNFTSNGALETSNASELITGQLSSGPTCAPFQWQAYWYLIPIAVGLIISVPIVVWKTWRRPTPTPTLSPGHIESHTRPLIEGLRVCG